MKDFHFKQSINLAQRVDSDQSSDEFGWPGGCPGSWRGDQKASDVPQHSCTLQFSVAAEGNICLSVKRV